MEKEASEQFGVHLILDLKKTHVEEVIGLPLLLCIDQTQN